MKNKTKTYFLLVAVLGIWGLIGYKIVSALNPHIPTPPDQEMMVNFKPQTNTEKDTFSIQTAARDPFLGTAYKKSNTTSNTTNRTSQPIEWPQITYGGLVKKQQSNEQVFVVNINTAQYLLKRGQTMDEVKLLRGNAKEISVLFKNQQKTIAIQK